MFNEKLQNEKILVHVKEQGSLSAEQIADKIGINVMIAKDYLLVTQHLQLESRRSRSAVQG